MPPNHEIPIPPIQQSKMQCLTIHQGEAPKHSVVRNATVALPGSGRFLWPEFEDKDIPNLFAYLRSIIKNGTTK